MPRSCTGCDALAPPYDLLRQPVVAVITARSNSNAMGMLTGLLVLAAVFAIDVRVGGRTIPATSALLGPLIASALAGPLTVVLLGAFATALAGVLASADGIPQEEVISRVVLVAVSSAFSVGVAVVRSRRERDAREANQTAELNRTLQLGLLPTTRSTAHLSVSSVYQPGQRDLLLGGDFIDVLPLPDGRTAFCVGDVSGHGPTAAALGAALRAGWRSSALTHADPVAWLEAMDRLLAAESGDEQFATVLVGMVDADASLATFANAGHPLPIRLTDTAEILPLKAGPPLGLPDGLGGGWTMQDVTLGVRWSLLLYTDGLIEGRRAPGSALRYGDHSLAAWLGDSSDPSQLGPQDLDRLLRDVQAANGRPLEDDVAVVLIRSAVTAV